MIIRNGSEFTLTGWHAAVFFAVLLAASFGLGYTLGVW